MFDSEGGPFVKESLNGAPWLGDGRKDGRDITYRVDSLRDVRFCFEILLQKEQDRYASDQRRRSRMQNDPFSHLQS